MDLPTEALEAPLQELIDNFVLEPPGVRGLYDFRHQLLRDAIYRSVPVGDRRRFHARAGEFGAQLEGASEIHSSLHFERAGLRRQAFEAALAGAREAARLSAHREAVELYLRAVDNMPADRPAGGASGDPGRRRRTRRPTSRITRTRSRWPCGRRRVPRGRRCRSRRSTRSCSCSNIARREARPLAERRRARAAPCGRAGRAARHAARSARGPRQLAPSYMRDHPMDAVTSRTRGTGATLRTSPKIGASRRSAAQSADWKEACADAIAGRRPGRRGTIGAIAFERREPARKRPACRLSRRPTVAATGMDYAAARHWLGEGVRYADSIEQSHCAHVMAATSALVSWAGGDVVRAQPPRRARRWPTAAAGAAQRCSRRALGVRGHGSRRPRRGHARCSTDGLWPSATIRGDRAHPAAALGPGRGGASGRRSRAGVRGCARTPSIAPRPSASGSCSCHSWSPGSAPPSRPAGRSRPRRSGWPMRGTAGTDPGHRAARRSTTDAGWSRSRKARPASPGRRSSGRSPVGMRRADLGGDLGAPRPRELPRPHESVRRGASLGGGGRGPSRRGSSRRLWPIAQTRSSAWRAGRISVEEPWRPLTAREFAVARLVSEGYTNAEIADSLGIAPKTASSHVEHILAKLGASRRAEIATWASTVERSPLPN